MSRKPPSVSGRPLRRKLALALAVPMLFAATFGSLRVRQGGGSNARPRRRRQPGDGPAGRRRLPRRLRGRGRRRAAQDRRRRPRAGQGRRQGDAAADDFAAAADAADLSPTQRAQADSIFDLSTQLRDGPPTSASVSPSPRCVSCTRGETQLITDIVNEQLEPEPLLLVLGQALDGRLSLSMQQFQVAYDDGAGANPVDLAAELGVEAAAIDRLGAALGTTETEVSELNQGNAHASAR